MGWVGVGGGTNNIGGAFELSLAGPNNTDSILRGCYHRAGMTAVPFSYPWQNIAQHRLRDSILRGCYHWQEKIQLKFDDLHSYLICFGSQTSQLTVQYFD